MLDNNNDVLVSFQNIARENILYTCWFYFLMFTYEFFMTASTTAIRFHKRKSPTSGVGEGSRKEGENMQKCSAISIHHFNWSVQCVCAHVYACVFICVCDRAHVHACICVYQNLCACVLVFVHVSLHLIGCYLAACTCASACSFVCICLSLTERVYIYKSVCLTRCICICASLNLCMCVCACVCFCVGVFLCVYVCISECLYVCSTNLSWRDRQKMSHFLC